jgi:hypothetical protein
MGVAATFAAGCSGDDNTTGGGNPPGNDASTNDAPATQDTGGGDTNTPHPDANTPVHAKVILVHAAPGAPAVRVCFAQGQQDDGSDKSVAAFTALPDKISSIPPYGTEGPGIYPGTGGPFPDLADLSQIAITPYIVLASKIANQTADAGLNELTCDKLIGGDGKGVDGGLVKNVDFFELATVAKGKFTPETTFLFALTGCLPDAGSPQECGSGTGLSVGISTLDRSVPSAAGANGFGVQFENRSSALEGTPAELPAYHDPAAAGVIPFVQYAVAAPDAGPADSGPDTSATDGGDGGSGDDGGTVDSGDDGSASDSGTEDATVDASSGGDAGPSGPPPGFVPVSQTPIKFSGATVTPTVAVGGNSGLYFGVGVPKLDGGSLDLQHDYPFGDRIALPASVVEQLTWGAAAVPTCTPGTNCTYVLLGDPSKPPLFTVVDGGVGLNPGYDGRGLHFLAFPNDPPFAPK